jgi:phospholipid transport system substrate-binding protein
MKQHITPLVLALFIAPSLTHAGPPTDLLKAKVNAARSVLQKKAPPGTPAALKNDEELRSVIAPVLDFQRMSENALRAHWPKLSESERVEFVALFRALLFRSYLTRIRKANEDYTLQYEDEEAKGRKAASVTVIAQTPKAEIELIFHVYTTDGKMWITEDVIIDEVSLVQNYREQFTRIIKRDGYPVLLQKMANKLVDLGGTVPVEVTSVTAKVASPEQTLPTKKGTEASKNTSKAKGSPASK